LASESTVYEIITKAKTERIKHSRSGTVEQNDHILIRYSPVSSNSNSLLDLPELAPRGVEEGDGAVGRKGSVGDGWTALLRQPRLQLRPVHQNHLRLPPSHVGGGQAVQLGPRRRRLRRILLLLLREVAGSELGRRAELKTFALQDRELEVLQDLLHVVPVFLIAFTMREDRQRWLATVCSLLYGLTVLRQDCVYE